MSADPCPAFLPLLVRAGDGSIDAAGQRELTAHLAGCAACRAAFDEQSATHDLLAARPMARAPLGFADRVVASIARETWLDVFDFRRLSWRLAPVALAAAVVAYSVVATRASGSQATSAATDVTDLPVSAALMSDQVGSNELVPLMLFASPDGSLSSALQDATQ